MVVFSTAFATELSSSEQVTRYIQASTGRIHLYTVNLYSPAVAQALHQALTQRGVQLYLYTTCEALLYPSTGSMLWGLAWAGGALFVISTVQESGVMVVDDRYALIGPLVYRTTTPQDPVTHLYAAGENGYRSVAEFINRLVGQAVPVEIADALLVGKTRRNPCARS